MNMLLLLENLHTDFLITIHNSMTQKILTNKLIQVIWVDLCYILQLETT